MLAYYTVTVLFNAVIAFTKGLQIQCVFVQGELHRQLTIYISLG